MTHRLLLVLALFHPLGALAQEQPDALDRPYDQVIELSLDASIPSDVPPVVVDESAVRSAVTLDSTGAQGDVPPATSYEAALSNAQRSQQPAGSQTSNAAASAAAEPAPAQRLALPAAQPTPEPKRPGKASVSPTSPPVAISVPQTASAPAAAPVTNGATAVSSDGSMQASAALTGAQPVAAPPLAVMPEPPAPVAPPAAPSRPLAVPAPSQPAVFHAPGSRAPQTPQPEHVQESSSAGKEKRPSQTRRQRRDDDGRALSTVFGSRRGPRFLGAYGSLATQAPGFSGPASAAGQLAVVLGGTFRFGLEVRGLRYGANGPDVQLASTGWLMGLTLNQRKLVHPVFDVVLGGGIVSRRDGPVYGSVGTSVVRGGAELNVTRAIRLTATLGWNGIASPNPAVRSDLNGLEAAIGVRVGWF